MAERTLPGLSGAKVIEHDGIVEKTGPSVRQEMAWYDKVRKFGFFNVPQMKGLIHDNDDGSDTLGMSFIDGPDLTTIDALLVADELDSAIRKLRSIPWLIRSVDIETIADRIEAHVAVHPELFDADAMARLQNKIVGPLRAVLESEFSFSHGDLAVDNILWSHEYGLVLIDPIYELTLYSSWLADIAKLRASIDINVAIGKWDAEDSAFYLTLGSVVSKKWEAFEPAISALVVYQMVRTVKYRNAHDAWVVAQLIKQKCQEYGI